MVEFWVLSPKVGGAPTLEYGRSRLSLGAPAVVEIGDSAPAASLRRSRRMGRSRLSGLIYSKKREGIRKKERKKREKK